MTLMDHIRKETVENKQSSNRDTDVTPESPSSQGHSSSADSEEPPLEPLPPGFLRTLQEAAIGETFGPVAATIWEDSRVPLSGGKVFSNSEVTRFLRMVLASADGSEESFTFFPVLRREDAHLIIQRNYEGVYVKVAKKFDLNTELRGFCVSMERHDWECERVQVKQESSDEPPECRPHSRTSHEGCREENSHGGDYVKASKKFDSKTELREFCSSMERHDRECDRVHVKQEPLDEPSECRPQSRTNHQDGGEENPFIPQKCPNCSVCFRNLNNLEAHQKYYCTGRLRDQNSLANSQPDQGTCKRLNASLSSSPSLPSRSSSRTSADAIDIPFVHVCQLCQSSFTSRQNCESHMLILHCSEHVAMCKFCNFVAQSWDILREHVFSHVKMERRREEEVTDNQQVSRHDCDAHTGQHEEHLASEEEAVNHRTLQRIPLNGVQREVIHSPGGSKITVQVSQRVCDDLQELSHGSRPTKRPSESVLRAKRARIESPSPSHASVEESKFSHQTVVEIPVVKLTHHSAGHNLHTRELGPMPALTTTVCTACNICFRSKTNFMAHKKYYCKERHSESKDGTSVSNDRRDLPAYHSPRQTESPRSHHEENGHDLSIKESSKSRDDSPGSDGTRVMKPPPVVYMSPMVPSAMFVGGTQLISPSGAHVISPIFLLTPPVAIPVTSVEASQSSPPLESRSKRTGKDDSPLDLSVRSSTASPEETRRTSPITSHDTIVRKEAKQDPDKTEQESPSTSKKSFTCGYCGVKFWKAKTLIAHKQFYCSKINKPLSTSPPSSSHSTHMKTRETDSIGKLETPLKYPNHPLSITNGANFTSSSYPDYKKTPGNTSRERSHHEYHVHERHAKPLYLHETLVHHPHGFHHCSGCGVAFRKMESLEIHQKFYCQKPKPAAAASSPASASHLPVTHKKLNGHWEDHLQQSNRTEKSRPEKLGSYQSQDLITTASNYSLKNNESDLRYAESLPTRKLSEISKKHKIKRSKDRRGSSSPVLGGGGRYSWSSWDHERPRTRSWPSPVGKLPFTGYFQNDTLENSLTRSHGHIPKLLSVTDKPSDVRHCQRDSHHCDADKQDFFPDKVKIKVEENLEAENLPNDSKLDKTNNSINGKSQGHDTKSSQGIHQTDSSFPTGSKACRSCNISFQSLSTFIAHKKFYCSTASSQKSKVTT